MIEPSTIFSFIKAVAHYWLPLALSGAPWFIALLYKQWKPDFSFEHHLRWIIIVGVLVSTFLAWNDEYTNKIKLGNEKTGLETAATAFSTQIRELQGDLVERNRQIKDLGEKLAEVRLKSVSFHARDKLCEQRVAYRVTPNPLPDKPYNQRMTISKPHTVLYKFRIISSSLISVPLGGDSRITSYSSGAETAEYEPISEISVASGVRDEFTFPIDSSEPFLIKCVGRVH